MKDKFSIMSELQYGQYNPEQDEETITGLAFKVILYNDDWHTFDEVIVQLIKAIKCSYETAREFAFEVHVKGKAIVYNGQLQECLKVTSVLEEIALNTQIVA
ncbi:MAG: ATP-dependent Clp protease adaptor ClpS [Bacteroidota bacterium]|nr:ATP-dependent Clp protease adaptor ClpS [Bacteroidota bacterium]MDP4193611.1 ATP-dependent Clp protease adaptor ClpS [Bacteroidota bacterium]